MKKLIKTSLTAFIFAAAFVSCSSSPKEIPMELTAQELIQKGQDAFESGRYKESLAYYLAITERYTDSLPVYVEASYEIGHLYMKQKKYNLAEPIFQEILLIYERVTPGEIPSAYLKLAQLELKKIPR